MSGKIEWFSLCAVLLLWWAALAFGAEYFWPYARLLVVSCVVGVLGLLASPTLPFPSRALTLALVTVSIGGVVQLIPLSRRAIRIVSPFSVAADYRQLYAQVAMQPLEPTMLLDGEARRPASIAPSRTVLGLVFLATFTILLVGGARGIGTVGAEEMARGIVVLGLVVALGTCISRRTTTTSKSLRKGDCCWGCRSSSRWFYSLETSGAASAKRLTTRARTSCAPER